MSNILTKIYLNTTNLLSVSLQENTIDGIKKDTTNINVTYFKESIKERYSGNNFNYSINDTDGINLIQLLFRKLFTWLKDVFGFDIDVNYQTLEYIVYAILGIGALYLFIKFLLQSPVSSIFKNEIKPIDPLSFTEETLTITNFDNLIKKALKNNNYRLATRFLYLKSLQALSKKEIIKWNYDKTNSEYLNEIKDIQTKTLFKRASYIYDYVWYGEFAIDETNYNQNILVFNQLNKISNE